MRTMTRNLMIAVLPALLTACMTELDEAGDSFADTVADTPELMTGTAGAALGAGAAMDTAGLDPPRSAPHSTASGAEPGRRGIDATYCQDEGEPAAFGVAGRYEDYLRGCFPCCFCCEKGTCCSQCKDRNRKATPAASSDDS